MKDMIERYESVTQDTLMARSLYFEAFDHLRDLSHNKDVEKPQIVVFIDDLDRCFPEQAVRLLESVKLILHQPRFSFVLGIYPRIVEEFIRNKYAAQYPMAAASAASRDDDDFRSRMNNYLDYFKNYLDKIVQVRHNVPGRRPDQMHDYISELLKEAGVTSEFIVEGISKKDLFELIAEVGKRSLREIVRRINGLIVKWRIAKSEKDDSAQYDLLAGLINEIIFDRVTEEKTAYKQFLHFLGLPTEKAGSITYGKSLADTLVKIQSSGYHGEKISKLKECVGVKDSRTMISLIEILEKDEHLCNVLDSGPGRKWLSDKKYREEMRETYEEIKPGKEVQEAKKEELLHRELEAELTADFEHVIQGLRMVKIDAAKFEMGNDDGRDNEKPIHAVTIDAFEISTTPVTQAQYEAIMGVNPSYFKGKGQKGTAELPVENVSWNDAMVFCEQLTKRVKGKARYTLPTEAQWEYACRAKTDTRFYTGDENTDLDQAGWYNKNSQNQTHPVGEKEPNSFGLYDMHGNVWEWCLDWFGENYYDVCKKQGIVQNPTGPEGGSRRVLRGGSWDGSGQGCRSAFRGYNGPGDRRTDIGFRLVFVP